MPREWAAPPDKARKPDPGATGAGNLVKDKERPSDTRSSLRPQAGHRAAALRFLAPARRGWR